MTKYNAELFLTLTERGLRDSEIAKAFSVTDRSIARWRKTNGLPLQGPRPRTVRHGTRTAYSSYGCRCAECREGHRLYAVARRAKRYEHTQTSGLPVGVEHGRSAYCNWGCRCPECRADWGLKMSADSAARKARAAS